MDFCKYVNTMGVLLHLGTLQSYCSNNHENVGFLVACQKLQLPTTSQFRLDLIYLSRNCDVRIELTGGEKMREMEFKKLNRLWSFSCLKKTEHYRSLG